MYIYFSKRHWLDFDVADKLLKAEELTKKLTLDKSWKGAIKLVSAMRLPALAERLSAMYEVIKRKMCPSIHDGIKKLQKWGRLVLLCLFEL